MAASNAKPLMNSIPLPTPALLEAPRTDIDAVIAKHESVCKLVENGCLHLFAIEDDGRVIVRIGPDGGWVNV